MPNVWDLRTPAAVIASGDGGNCELCGRALDQASSEWIEVANDGTLIPEGDPRSGTSESQGLFEFGSDCARRLRRLP